MSAYRSQRFGRSAAERFRRGESAAGDRAVQDLLAAVTAPARDGELDGEDAAVMAFRAAHLHAVPQLRRRSMIKAVLVKLLTTKIAAAGVTAAVAVGGVAAVAATGHLPGPLGRHSTVAPATSVASSASADPTSQAHPTGRVNAGDHDASPSPSLVGLCRAYTAGAGSEHGKALESPAFTILINTAGGKDKVDVYCAGLLAEQHEAPSSADAAASLAPAAADHGGEARRTEAPSATHPTGAPSMHPGR